MGNFEPVAYRTKGLEVGYKIHPKGQKWPRHYHKASDEINLLVKGKMKIKKMVVKAGEIFVINRNEIVDPVFLKDCELVVVRVPNIRKDKVIV